MASVGGADRPRRTRINHHVLSLSTEAQEGFDGPFYLRAEEMQPYAGLRLCACQGPNFPLTCRRLYPRCRRNAAHTRVKRFEKLSRGERSLVVTLSQSNDMPKSIQVTLTSSNLSVKKCGGSRTGGDDCPMGLLEMVARCIRSQKPEAPRHLGFSALCEESWLLIYCICFRKRVLHRSSEIK